MGIMARRFDPAAEFELQVLLARQPIFSCGKEIIGFELLFRDGTAHTLKELTDDEATLDVLLNTYSSVYNRGLQKNVPVHLKVTDHFLLNNELPDLPRDRFIIQILSHTEVSDPLIEVVSGLVNKGYRIALSGYDPANKSLKALFTLAHLIKIDIRKRSDDQLRRAIHILRQYNLSVLADKVETEADFQRCKTLGFEGFMGYFLSKPELVEGRKITNHKQILLGVLAELQDPGATASSVEAAALKDPALIYRILRLVNSAAVCLRREIHSISEAITLLGFEQLRRWVMLFLASSEDHGIPETSRMALQRARMCELYAEMLELPTPTDFFILGLLSQLEAILAIRKEELVNQIPVGASVKRALLTHEGTLGEVLTEVEHFEKGEFSAMKHLLKTSYAEAAYRHSIAWSNHVLTDL